MATELVRRTLATWADDAVAFADVLRRQDPSWGTETFPLAGGQAVLCGPGLYVNRALAAGHDRPLGADDLELLEARSAAVGVTAAVDVGPVTHPAGVEELSRRGYAAVDEVAVLVRELGDVDVLASSPTGLRIDRADGDLLDVWQETSAIGWGHTTDVARRASDAFARAAAAIDGEHFELVRSGDRPVACASLTMRSGVATLGGMSTRPDHRRRGIQSALIVERLRAAAATGCDLAASTAAPGGGSERNLLRHGFVRVCTVATWVRAGGGSP